MTDELKALLERIQAAGGPLEVDGDFFAAHWPAPRGDTTSNLRYALDHAEALIVHALKLDVRRRGHSWSSAGGHMDFHTVAVYPCGFPRPGEVPPAPLTKSLHKHEVIAWCRAWLATFGKGQVAA